MTLFIVLCSVERLICCVEIDASKQDHHKHNCDVDLLLTNTEIIHNSTKMQTSATRHQVLSPKENTNSTAISSEFVLPINNNAAFSENTSLKDDNSFSCMSRRPNTSSCIGSGDIAVDKCVNSFTAPKTGCILNKGQENCPKTFLQAFHCLEEPVSTGNRGPQPSDYDESCQSLPVAETTIERKETAIEITNESNYHIVPQADGEKRQIFQPFIDSRIDQKVPCNEEFVPFDQNENIFHNADMYEDKCELLSSEAEEDSDAEKLEKADDG